MFQDAKAASQENFMKTELTFKDLKEQLDDIHRRFPTFKEDDLFVCWFLRAYLTEDEKQAAEAVTGGSGDKSVDGVLIDHKAKAVFLLQGKYRQKVAHKAESRGDVMGFANLAKPFADSEPGPFKILTKGMNPTSPSSSGMRGPMSSSRATVCGCTM